MYKMLVVNKHLIKVHSGVTSFEKNLNFKCAFKQIDYNQLVLN